jgi:hypothetical protein
MAKAETKPRVPVRITRSGRDAGQRILCEGGLIASGRSDGIRNRRCSCERHRRGKQFVRGCGRCRNGLFDRYGVRSVVTCLIC